MQRINLGGESKSLLMERDKRLEALSKDPLFKELRTKYKAADNGKESFSIHLKNIDRNYLIACLNELNRLNRVEKNGPFSNERFLETKAFEHGLLHITLASHVEKLFNQVFAYQNVTSARLRSRSI